MHDFRVEVCQFSREQKKELLPPNFEDVAVKGGIFIGNFWLNQHILNMSLQGLEVNINKALQKIHAFKDIFFVKSSDKLLNYLIR